MNRTTSYLLFCHTTINLLLKVSKTSPTPSQYLSRIIWLHQRCRENGKRCFTHSHVPSDVTPGNLDTHLA